MKKNGNKVFTLIMFFLVLGALGFYIHLSNESPDHQDVKETSEKEKLLNYDMENEYPKTVRETVKLHCRYLKYVYNNDFTDDELFTVNQQIRKLFDEELLENNTADKQLQGLKDEITLYEANKQKFTGYRVAEASQVEYNTEEGKEYAKIRVTLSLSINSASASVDEEYILRQDENGKWKILGWQAINQGQATDEGDAE